MIESAINVVLKHPDYKILKRIPDEVPIIKSQDAKIFCATIIDLETMGIDAKNDAIIEIGMLSFAFTNGDGILSIEERYNELQDPGKTIPPEITKITGISNEDVKGKTIDWEKVLHILTQTHLIICHNSRFDRNFLELQTPESIKSVIEKKPFACTIKDINWKSRGYESSKLEYLNFKLGYFYEGHRAIVDCFATLNLLLEEQGAFDELKANVRCKETLLCAVHAPFDKKDMLKSRQYRWADGNTSLPKCRWKMISNKELALEKEWLDEHIYQKEGSSEGLPSFEITAYSRYSFRSEQIEKV